MRATRRPTGAARILATGLAARLALGLVLTGCADTSDSAEDRAAEAAGGQGSRDDGGLGRATVSPPSADRAGPSSPAAPHGADEAERGSQKVAGPAPGPRQRPGLRPFSGQRGVGKLKSR
jgi:hypothetical protein